MNALIGNAVQDYYLDLVRKNHHQRKERLAALKTKEDALRYAAEVCAKIQKCFPLPEEKTPLNAVEMGDAIDFGTYTMHKIVYESRPNYPVTTNLYLPKVEGKVPASIFLCGHSEDGKAGEAYQLGARGLAMKGFAVLVIDPVGQGERHQFVGALEDGRILGCTKEHNIMHKQMYLTGETMGAWRAWDAIRGIDYLLTRPEVDPERIGVTGNSGGGTMTTFVNALDARLMMAAPSCYVTTWLHNVENELPADAEQMPMGALAAGLEMGDFLIARAPRPVMILGQKNDFFDPRGTSETYEEVRDFYRLLGAEDDVQLFIGPTNHGYSVENRQAMYGFFGKHAGVNCDGVEPQGLPTSKPEELFCLPEGKVENYAGNKFVCDIIREKAAQLVANRKSHTLEELRAILLDKLQLEMPGVPYFRTLRPGFTINTGADKYFQRFGLESEENNWMMSAIHTKEPYNYIQDTDEAKTLYIPHLDARDEMDAMGVKAGDLIYGLDMRGVGDFTPLGCDQHFRTRDFFAEYAFDYHFASLAFMFDKPMLGRRVNDILCAV